MTMTALHLPHKELRFELRRAEDGTMAPAWDLYLDGALVASGYPSQDEAQRELDLIAWYTLFGEAPLAPHVAIADAALDLALTVFDHLFTDAIVREKARTARAAILRAGIYAVLPDGSLSVTASSGRGRKGARAAYTITAARTAPADTAATADAYQVTMACECPDFWTRARTHGGICKHIAARLLLFLAQQGLAWLRSFAATCTATPAAPAALPALDQPTVPPAAPVCSPPHAPRPDDLDDTLAFVEVPGDELAAGLFLAQRAATPVLVRAVAGALQITAGQRRILLPGLDGGGCAALTLAADALTTLYDQLRPCAKAIGVIQVFLDPASHDLALCGVGTTFSVQVAGTPA